MRQCLLVGALAILACGCQRADLQGSLYPIAWNADDARGVRLEKWLQGSLRGLKENDKALLAIMGHCESCSANKFAPGMEAPGKYKRVVIVYQDAEKNLLRLGKFKVGSLYRIIADPKDHFGSATSLQLAPRLFELDHQGTILRAQVFDRVQDGMLK